MAGNVDRDAVLADLKAEGDDLAAVVGALDDQAWSTPTPAEGWTIAHQIAHLAWTDQLALLAIHDPVSFGADLRKAATRIDSYVDDAAAAGARRPPAELLEAWQQGRAELRETLGALSSGEKIAWFGPPMSATSMATARLMETWAHSGDITDALGIQRVPTPRIRHVAHLGVRTRDFAFLLHGLQPPSEPFRVELLGPDGQCWSWGEVEARQRVTGPGIDFCLLATQRVNRADTALVAEGEDADTWLDIIQAFAGAPGAGRPASAHQAS